jgi:hypothetical protein
MSARNSAATAVASPNFALHTLGWRAFQDLCLVVMREELGQTVQAFADSNDGGRDGAFEGIWNPDGAPASALNGHVVVQCKATVKDGSSISLTHLTDEVAKAKKLVQDGRCDSYILMTNASVSGDAAGKIEDELKAVGVKHFLVYERNRINLAIASNSRLRRFVPRVYGLGDLSSILDERRYDQAKALIASLGKDLSTFVPTESHKRAVEAVEKHGFVLLLGDPASGKTVIASTLAAAAMHEWDCLVQRPTTPEALVEGWNPNEPAQFFWLDDVFGSVRYDPSKAESWVANAPSIRAALSKGTKVVLTSRGYIWNEARKMLKTYTFPLLTDNQVVIDLAELSLVEKKRMLYNHIRLGNQESSYKEELRPLLTDVAALPSFKPEIARRLGAREFTRGLALNKPSVHRFFTHNEEFTAEIFEALDVHYKAALSLVYMSVDGLQTPISGKGISLDILNNLGTNVGQVSDALNAMKESFVRLVESSDDVRWQFWHPTLREGFAGLISNDPQLLDVFVEGLSPSNIVEKLNCGGKIRKTGQGNLVTVPSSLYRNVVRRLTGFVADADNLYSVYFQERRYAEFLTKGTSDEFLRLMIQEDPYVVTRLFPRAERFDGSMVIDLCSRLHALGLLDEASRSWIVSESLRRAVEVPDDSWISDTVLTLHTEAEVSTLVQRLRDELLPAVDGLITSWSDSWDSGDDPDEYFNSLVASFDSYNAYFAGIGEFSMAKGFKKASQSAERHLEAARDLYEPAGEPDWEANDEHHEDLEDHSGRDMFDDVHH